MGLAHGDTLFAMIPAFSKISISSCTHCTCLRAKSVWPLGNGRVISCGYIHFQKWGLSKSAESLEKMVSNSEHRSSNAFLCSGVTSASLNLMGSRGSMSAGEVIKTFFISFQDFLLHFPRCPGFPYIHSKISSCVIMISSDGAFW